MSTLILGASGATGKLLVDLLLGVNHNLKIIIRENSTTPHAWHDHNNLEIIKANITEMRIEDLASILKNCDAVVSCLGHNISLKGIYGKPRKLVTDTVKLTCEAIKYNQNNQPTKFILMNTAGNQNRDLNEPLSLAEKNLLQLLRWLVPPHPDNEQAADYLRLEVGKNNPYIEWVVVRPDALLNLEQISDYSIHPSPTSSAIFAPGKTSRINVAHFKMSLLTKNELWDDWKGQMPVIYNN